MRNLKLITRLLSVAVVVGLVLLLTGWLDELEPITMAWISPTGEVVLISTETDQALAYELEDLRSPIARRELPPGASMLAWADERNLVLRRGSEVLVLGVDDLIERPWFTSDREFLLLGRSGRMLMGVDPAQPEAPIRTFMLSNWQVGEMPAPGVEARGLPFETLLMPADTLAEGASLDLDEGRLTIQHPSLSGARRLSLPRPRIWAVALVLGLAVLLFVLRRVHHMRSRMAGRSDPSGDQDG